MWRFVCAAWALLVCLGITLHAAPVSWLPNSSGLWQTPANWSSSPNLPGFGDDVTIDRPAAITVTLSSGNQNVRSLLSQENLVIGTGTALTLSIGAGGGQANGSLTIGSEATLRSQDGGNFQASGSTTANSANLHAEMAAQLHLPITTYSSGANNAQFRALSGGTVGLSALTNYTAGTGGSFLQANGVGSTLNLPAVTSFAGGTNTNSKLYAENGGTINLPAVTVITVGATEAVASGANSKINFTNLATFSGNQFNDARRFRAAGGGQIISPNLVAIGPQTHVELSGATSVLDLADLVSVSELNFLAENAASLSLPAAITSYSSTNFNSQFRAFTGGTLAFSTLTGYSAGTGGSLLQSLGAGSSINLSAVTSFLPGTNVNTRIYAQQGGTINLNGVASIATGAVDAIASGANSRISLTSLTSFNSTNLGSTRRLRAEDGGVIQLRSAGTTTVMNTSVEVDATGTIAGDTFQLSTGGTLSGNGLIDANYAPTAGAITQFKIGGTAVDTQFDQIVIDGNATLNGTLKVLLTNNFVPTPGQSFEVLKVNGTRSGTFSGRDLPTLTGGLQWSIFYGAQSVSLQVVNFYGDYNGNGIVDAADYIVWRESNGATGLNLPADGDRNGVVNQLDFNFWKSKFGATSGSGTTANVDSLAAAVPEPAFCSLLMAGLGVVGSTHLARRRKK